MPDSKHELFNLLDGNFEVEIENIREINSEPPGSKIVFRGVKCRRCEMHFIQEVYKSVFGEQWSFCPNCKFPQNALNKFARLEGLEEE